MSTLIGRNEELQEMDDLLRSSESEFLAIYGRRRIGKTYLIRNAYHRHIVFQMTGFADATTAEQLSNFLSSLHAADPDLAEDAPPNSWLEAFEWLKGSLSRNDNAKKVIFSTSCLG